MPVLYKGPDLTAGTYADLVVNNSISIREIAGREGTDTVNGGTASRAWLVKGNKDPLTCRTALVGNVSIDTYDGLFISSLSRERVGPEEWIFTANYDMLTPQVGGYSVSIDTTGASILQLRSYSQTRFAAAGKTAPDMLKAIDVQDGVPQGVERIIPALKISIRAKIATEYVESPLRYSKLIAQLTGTTNNAAIYDDGEGNVFEAGELLFAGATGEVIAENPMLTFIFLASKNLTSVTLQGITGINKKGHEYLWYLPDYEKDSTTGLLVSRPRAAYVDQVYEPADHSLLKIGVAPT